MISTRARNITAGVLAAAALTATGAYGGSASARPETDPNVTQVRYDADDTDEFADRWTYAYGPLELAAGATQEVTKKGITVDATPFRTSFDFSVFDHLKYLGISTDAFAVPESNLRTSRKGAFYRIIYSCYTLTSSRRPSSSSGGALV